MDQDLFRRRRFWGRAMIWAAVLVVLPPLLGAVGTVVDMVRAFGTLGRTGQADPAALSGSISFALLSTMWGLVLAGPAFIFLIIAMVRYSALPMLTVWQTSEEGGP